GAGNQGTSPLVGTPGRPPQLRRLSGAGNQGTSPLVGAPGRPSRPGRLLGAVGRGTSPLVDLVAPRAPCGVEDWCAARKCFPIARAETDPDREGEPMNAVHTLDIPEPTPAGEALSYGTLSWQPAAEHADLLAAPVVAALADFAGGADTYVAPIDPEQADTA